MALDRTEDELGTALASGARQNIRKSRRSGVTVGVSADRASLEDFRLLHTGLRKSKYRLLAQPRSFFDALHRHLAPDNLRTILARLDGEPVASVVLLQHGDWAYSSSTLPARRAWFFC